MTELPFSEFVAWLEARCDGGWSIDRTKDGDMVVNAWSLSQGAVRASNGEFWRGATHQLRQCIVEIAGKIGIEA
jgi:hypothetical protein